MINGRQLDKYQLINKVADGGMASVWEARHLALERAVAVKTPHPQFSKDDAFTHRFLREARAMARLHHENIIHVYDVLEEDGSQHIVMEYFPSRSLKELLKNKFEFSQQQIFQIAHQIAKALAFAHANGVIHRDVKPANILIDSVLKLKLADFGIAAAAGDIGLTLTGEVVGTPRYMSPEQARGDYVDGRSDIFSVGMVFYELLTRSTPLDGISYAAAIGVLANQDSEFDLNFPENTPVAIRELIVSMLKRKTEDRVSSMQTVVNTLRDYVDELDATVVLDPLIDDATRIQASSSADTFSSKAHIPILSAAIFFMFLLSSLMFVYLNNNDAPVSDVVQVSEPRSDVEQVVTTIQTSREEVEVIEDIKVIIEPEVRKAYEQKLQAAKQQMEELRDLAAHAEEQKMTAYAGPTFKLASERYTAAEESYIQWSDLLMAEQFDAFLNQEASVVENIEQATLTFRRAMEIAATRKQEDRERLRREQEQEKRAKMLLEDKKHIRDLFEKIAVYYESRDMHSIAQVSNLSKKRQLFLKSLFEKYSSIEVAIESLTVEAKKASAVINIERLLLKNGHVVIPSESWRRSTLVIDKNGSKWGKVQW